jgi:hypothetical protein
MRVVVLLLLLFCNTALAWWATPHMLIAEIAYQNLNLETRNKIDLLLAEDFVQASTYADEIRKQGNHDYNHWHYITLTFIQQNDPMPEVSGDDNVVSAIAYEITVLQDEKSTNVEKQESLKRLIHWVGDIHQPLHAASHVAAKYPQGDRGGNAFKIDMPDAYNNLHSYWDSGLLQWPYLPQPLSTQDKKRLRSMAKSLQVQYPKPKIAAMDPATWVLESHKLARQAYQGIEYSSAPNTGYITWGREVSRQQVALAGYRLAYLLQGVVQ